MLLTEAQGKSLFRSVRIRVPAGAQVVDLACLMALKPDFPVAVKAQVAAGGRGKAGGVRRCNSAKEMHDAFSAIMDTEFDGAKPRGVIVESWLDIRRELYLAVVIDGAANGYSILYSPVGGVDVETWGASLRFPVGLADDFRGHLLRAALSGVEEDVKVRERVIGLARRMLECAKANDCLTVEINPLAVLEDGALVACDAKVELDESAAFRRELTATALADARANDPADVRICAESGLMLVWLDGAVGLISSGAGMTMAAMDAIDSAGGRAACFLDMSGNPTPGGFSLAFDLLDRSEQVRSILVSMFGGGMHMDRVARTLVDILAARKSAKPVVFRLKGARSEIAAEILTAAGHRNHETLEGAVDAILREREAA